MLLDDAFTPTIRSITLEYVGLLKPISVGVNASAVQCSITMLYEAQTTPGTTPVRRRAGA